LSKRDESDFEYDVCLSFAGEDRKYVRKVADELRTKGIRVFYDEYEEVSLWGKDLYEHLDDIYKNSARYCVLFVSKHYAERLWTNHERKSAQERAFKENKEYMLPARFDKTPIPGLRDTVGYISIKDKTAKDFANIIREKVGGHYKTNYLPPIPDRLYEELEVQDEEEKEEVFSVAHRFLDSLKRMSEEEREIIFHFFLEACPAELPDNVHINIDLLRRASGFTQAKIMRILANLRSLGFYILLREDHETEGHIGKDEMLVLEWSDMNPEGLEWSTRIAHAMIHGATYGYCDVHAMVALRKLDFSQLAESTTVIDHHE